MKKFHLTEQADPNLIFEIEQLRYSPEWFASHGLTKEITTRIFASWPSRGFAMGDKQIGGILFDGRYPHIAVLPQYYGRWAILWGEALDWLFSLKYPIEAKVEVDNQSCLRFMERNGWKRIAEDNENVTFLVERNAHCDRKLRHQNESHSISPSLN